MSTAMVIPTNDIAVREHALQARVTQEVIALVSSPKAAEIMSVVILNQFRKTPKLWQCSQESLMDAVARIARLRLDPAIPNEVWLVPYGNDATLLYGYGGLRKLALRSPEVRDIFAQVVCANDLYHPAENPVSLPVHKLPESFQPRGRAIGYYAAALLTCGTWRVVSMSKAEVAAHRDRYSASAKSQFWADNRPDLVGLTNFDKMAMKTVLRQLCSARHLSLDADVMEALAQEATLFQPTPGELQGQGDVPRIEASVAHEASKSVTEHVDDMFPPQDGGPTAYGTADDHERHTLMREAEACEALRDKVDTLLDAEGVSPAQQQRWRASMAKKYQCESYTDLREGHLTAMLASLTEAAETRATKTPQEPESTPTLEAHEHDGSAEDHDASCIHDEPELPVEIPPHGWREQLQHLASNTLEVVRGSKDKTFEASSIKTCEVILRLCENPTFTEEESHEQHETLMAIGRQVSAELGF